MQTLILVNSLHGLSKCEIGIYYVSSIGGHQARAKQ